MPWEDSRLAEGVSGATVWREPCSGLSWHFAACVHTCVHVYTGKHQHRHLAKKVRTCLTCPRGIWCWFACPLSFKIPWRWQYLQAAYNFVQFQVEVARLPSQCLNDSRHMSLLNPTPTYCSGECYPLSSVLCIHLVTYVVVTKNKKIRGFICAEQFYFITDMGFLLINLIWSNFSSVCCFH